jgi:hypothetical protein
MTYDVHVKVGIANSQFRLSELDQTDISMVEESLPIAYGTATHGHGLILDGTSKTIDDLEKILTVASDAIKVGSLNIENEEIRTFMGVFAIYLGEVFKVEHQGEWVKSHCDELGTSSLWVRSGLPVAILMDPFLRVQNRLFEGPEFNVADYYRMASKIARAA